MVNEIVGILTLIGMITLGLSLIVITPVMIVLAIKQCFKKKERGEECQY